MQLLTTSFQIKNFIYKMKQLSYHVSKFKRHKMTCGDMLTLLVY